MKKKVVAIAFATLFAGLILSPPTSGYSEKMKSFYKSSTLLTHENGGTDYWAVIVGVADYKIDKYDLPIPEKRLKVLYNALLSTKNWHRNHIKLLINAEATRKKILEVLDWLARKADRNDVVLFSFFGHGSQTPDRYPYDEKDGYDEVICPYDIKKLDNGDLENAITDDELNEKFIKIEGGRIVKPIKGSCLIFESCLSGGLVGRSVDKNGDGVISIEEANSTYNKGLEDDIRTTTDIDGRKRVIIMASLDGGLALILKGIGGPLTNALSLGFRGYADDKDFNKWVSAEEAFRYAKRLIFGRVLKLFTGICAIVFLESYILAKEGGKNDTEAIKTALKAVAAFLAMMTFQFVSYWIYIRFTTGYWVLSIPNMRDSYLGELDITET